MGVVLYVALFLLVVHLDDWARGLAIFFDTKDSQVRVLKWKLGSYIWCMTSLEHVTGAGLTVKLLVDI